MTGNAPITTRNEIARAVRSALVTHGYANLTTAHIAEASSKSEASLFYYYETKDDLLAVFIRRAPAWIDNELEEIDGNSPDERLRNICDLLLVPGKDNPLHGIQIAIMELTAHTPHNPLLQEPLEEYQRHLHEILADELQAGINQGIYRNSIDPEETASFILMVMDGATGSGSALEMQGMESDVQTELDRYLEGLTP